MAYPTTPGQSLNAAAVTSTASSGVGSTQATAAVMGTHSAVFTVTAFSQGANSEAELVLAIEGNLDGSTWVNIASMSIEANGTYLLLPNTGAGTTARIPMANLRASAYFKGFGSASPTATVSAYLASEA